MAARNHDRPSDRNSQFSTLSFSSLPRLDLLYRLKGLVAE